MVFWKNLTKEFNPFCHRSQNKKKMMKLGFSRKLKTKSNNSELNCKEFQKKRSKDM